MMLLQAHGQWVDLELDIRQDLLLPAEIVQNIHDLTEVQVESGHAVLKRRVVAHQINQIPNRRPDVDLDGIHLCPLLVKDFHQVRTIPPQHEAVFPQRDQVVTVEPEHRVKNSYPGYRRLGNVDQGLVASY